MKSIFIGVIAFLCVYFYNVFLINHYSKVVKYNLNKKFSSILLPIIMTIIMILIYFVIFPKLNFLPLAYLINFIINMFLFIIIFDITLGKAYILSIYQIFQLNICRDIIIEIAMLILGKTFYKSINIYDTNYLLTISSFILAFISEIILNKKKYINSFKKLLLYRKELLLNIITITSLIIILLNSNYIYYFLGDVSITSIIMLSNKICIYFCCYFAIDMVIKSINWVEKTIFYETNTLNLEYNDKLNKKIDEYSNLLKIYNHDFKNILLNIKDSIEIGDTKKAKEIIAKFDEKIEYLTNYNKKLSNNTLINALLNRLSEKCNYKNIYFEAECYITDKISISELDLISIFNNLSNNAYEACIKQNDNEKKWIKFKSYIKDNNLIIYQSNSYNGHIKFRNDKFITSKENKKLHGIGIESIKYIINEVNGMYFIKVNKENRKFEFLIKIPLLIEEQE